MIAQVMIAPDGRMSLPADLRKRLGVADGGALLIEGLPDGIVPRTVAQSIDRAHTLARRNTADKPEASVDGGE